MTFPPPTEKQAKILWISLTALAIGILLALTALLLIGVAWIANALSSVLIPLAIAGIIAYLLDPVVDWFHKKRGMKRHSSIILVFIIAVLLVGGLVASIVPALVEAIQKSNAPKLYICNLMTQPGETDGLDVSGHLRAIEAQLASLGISKRIFSIYLRLRYSIMYICKLFNPCTTTFCNKRK